MTDKNKEEIILRIKELNLDSLIETANKLFETIENEKKYYVPIINSILEALPIKLKGNKVISNYMIKLNTLQKLINKVSNYDILKINIIPFKEIGLIYEEELKQLENNNNYKDDSNSDRATEDTSFDENNDLLYPTLDLTDNKNENKNEKNPSFSQSAINPNSKNSNNSYDSNITMQDILNEDKNNKKVKSENNIEKNRAYKNDFSEPNDNINKVNALKSKKEDEFFCANCMERLIGNKGISFAPHYKDYIDILGHIVMYYINKLEHLMNAQVYLDLKSKITKDSCKFKDILIFLKEIESLHDEYIKIIPPVLKKKNEELRNHIKTNIDLQSGSIKKINNNASWNKLNILSNFKEHIFNNLSPECFNYKLDVPFFNSDEIILNEKELYYPPFGYFGIGLYHEITKNENWPYAYRPLNPKNDIEKIKNNLYTLIEKKNFEMFEPKQLCDDIDIRDKNKNKVGKGIYLIPNISFAEKYTALIDVFGKKYKILLMVKVCQRKIKQREKYKNIYWIVESEYIRICRILLKEIDNNKKS